MLQDLTHNVKKACVMDIKMGTKTYTSDSNVIKKWMLENKDSKTTTASLGFRVTGFRSFKRPSGEYDVKGRPWGMALTPDDIVENLSNFFDDGERSRLDVLEKYISRLEVLLLWYSEQNIIKMFSSSLLFVYDSEGDVDLADVHMIDFAHVKRIESPDDRDHGYISGLANLISIFKQIREAKEAKKIEKEEVEKHEETKTSTSSADPDHHVPRLDITEEGEKKKRRKSCSRDSPPTMSSEGSVGAEGEPDLSKTPKKHHHHHHHHHQRQSSKGDSSESTTTEDTETGGTPTRKSARRHKTPRGEKREREERNGETPSTASDSH